jgi:uncharacterized tellurite resistance protein B-like protein
MTDAVLIVLAVVVPVAAGVLIALYVRYRNTPAARWKQRIVAAAGKLEVQGRGGRLELARLDHASDLRSLREEYLTRLLSGIAVEELVRFPGIGPVTASRARDAGLSNLASLTRAKPTAIPGVGPSRAKDLREAIRQLRGEAESRFDAGACPEAIAFAEERKRREAGRQHLREAAEQSIRSAQAGLAGMEELIRIAREVSFFGYLARRPVPALTEELMAKPMPVVGASEVSTPWRAPDPTSPTPLTPGPSPREAGGEGRKPATPLEQLRAVAALGLAMAKADGRIAVSERRQVRAFLERRYAQGSDLIAKLDGLLIEVESKVPPLGDALIDVRRLIPQTAWPELYQFAASVADAAGERNTREIDCLARIAEELGIGVKPATPPVLAPSPMVAADAPLSESDCRAALEIAADSPLSVELIRRQYHLLCDRFAPDRFASHGPEFVRMAGEKRERAERAARHLLAAYNEPLEPPAAAPPADLRHNPDLDEVFGA